MFCDHDLSCARPACEPCSACASSASHAGGFAAGSPTGRASFSPHAQDRAALETEHEGHVAFPIEVFDCADAMPAASDVRIVAFRALLPAVRRIAVHAVERSSAMSYGRPVQSGHFGVYLIDFDGGEHPFLDFASAGGATYAAMRLAQVYRLPVEFGSFAEPKLRDQSNVAPD